ncbi:hypothetical protein ACLB2K_017658 [Fragaria x ananassa]
MVDTFPPGCRFHPSEQQLLSYYLSNKKAYPAIPTIGWENCMTYGASNRQSYRIGVGIRTITKGGRGTGTFIWLEFGRRRRKRITDIGKGKVRLGTSSTAKGLFWAPRRALSTMKDRLTQPHVQIGYSIAMLWQIISR